MKFWEAVKALDEGKKVTNRLRKDRDEYVELVEHKYVVKNIDESIPMFEFDFIGRHSSLSWEIVEINEYPDIQLAYTWEFKMASDDWVSYPIKMSKEKAMQHFNKCHEVSTYRQVGHEIKVRL